MREQTKRVWMKRSSDPPVKRSALSYVVSLVPRSSIPFSTLLVKLEGDPLLSERETVIFISDETGGMESCSVLLNREGITYRHFFLISLNDTSFQSRLFRFNIFKVQRVQRVEKLFFSAFIKKLLTQRKHKSR